MALLIVSLGLRLMMPGFANGLLPGGGDGSIGGGDEKVEGCYNYFANETSIELGRSNINNKRCQRLCTDRGYALSATGRNTTCFCGNNYPGPGARVDTRRCDQPCNPDKRSCFLFACCGSRNGQFYTVSWNGEQNPTLRTLRQLAYDYRTNATHFRRKTEAMFADRATFTLLPPEPTRERRRGPGTTSPRYLSLGSGCPEGWTLYDRWCYKTHFGQAATQQQARQACQAEGGELVTVTSQAESAFVAGMQGGAQGWLSVERIPGPPRPQGAGTASGGSWSSLSSASATGAGSPAPGTPLGPSSPSLASAGPVDLRGKAGETTAQPGWRPQRYEAWVPGEQAREVVEQVLWGRQNDTVGFREYLDAAIGVKSIKIGHGPDFVEGVQMTYSTRDGLEIPGSWRGKAQASHISVVDLQQGDEIARIEASVTGDGRIGNLNVMVLTRSGQYKIHGPFGSITTFHAARHVKREMVGRVVGLFGTLQDGKWSLLGFLEHPTPSCALMTPSGAWRAVGCAIPQPGLGSSVLCERRPDLGGRGRPCPAGLEDKGLACYRMYTMPETRPWSWLEAQAMCHSRGGHLPTVPTMAENQIVHELLLEAGGYIGVYKSPSGEAGPWLRDMYTNFEAPQVDAMAPFSPLAPPFEPTRRCFATQPDGQWRRIRCDMPLAGAVICARGSSDLSCQSCPSDDQWHAEGCMCYLRKARGTEKLPMSWYDAADVCESIGAQLASIKSPAENARVLDLTRMNQTAPGNTSAFIALNNLRDPGEYDWELFKRSSPDVSVMRGSPFPPGDKGPGCFKLGGAGAWVPSACDSPVAPCFTCKRDRATPFPDARVDQPEEWSLEMIGTGIDGDGGCRECYKVRVRHAQTREYLAADGLDMLYASKGIDSPWTTWIAVVDSHTGGILLLTVRGSLLRQRASRDLYIAPLSLSASAVKKPDLGAGAEVDTLVILGYPAVAEEDDAAVWVPNRPLGVLAWRFLRIRVSTLSRRGLDRGLRECSIRVYDLDVDTPSYECHLRNPLHSSDEDLIYLEQVALLITDQSRYVLPRKPLLDARTTCTNNSPFDNVQCILATGQAITLIRRFRIQWGYVIFDELTWRNIDQATQAQLYRYIAVRANPGIINAPANQRPNTVANLNRESIDILNILRITYNNFYQRVAIQILVETTTEQIAVSLPPRSSLTFQFWLEASYMMYRWRALFRVRGGFVISAFGQQLGTYHSVTDLSLERDLEFVMFGEYHWPVHAEIVLTFGEYFDKAYLGLRVPPQSQGDRVFGGSGKEPYLDSRGFP
jgi:hypothetical protein